MELLKDINLESSGKTKAESMQYPLNEQGLDRDECDIPDEAYMQTSIYHQLGKTNSINFYRADLRPIIRLVVPEVLTGIKGYGGYGIGKDGNFYADYFDGSAKEFNEQHSNGAKNFDKFNRTIIKIDNTTDEMSCVNVDANGGQTQFMLKSSSTVKMRKLEGNRSAAIMFAIVANALCKFESGRLNPGDKGYDVAKIINQHFTDYVNEKTTVGSQDDVVKALRALEGDVYSVFAFASDVKSMFGSNIFKPTSYEMTDYPVLNQTDFPEMEIFHGDSAILGGRKTLSETGGFANDALTSKKTVGELLKEDPERWNLDPNRTLTDEELSMIPHKDEMIPNPDLLVKATLIKASTTLPRPFRNLIFEGETGAGKTTNVQILAQILHRPYAFMTINPDTLLSDIYVTVLPSDKSKASLNDLEKFTNTLPNATEMAMDPVGSYQAITGEAKADATEDDCVKAITQKSYEIMSKSSDFMYVESQFVKAFREGWVFEFQEANVANKPGVLSGINAALDDLATIQLPTGEVIKRHPDSIIVMTANVDYEGTKRLNQAVKSRCTLKAVYTLPEEKELIKLIQTDSGFDDTSIIKKMIRVMYSIRKVLEETGTTDGSCGLREVIAWATATSIFIKEGIAAPAYTAALSTIVPSATSDLEMKPDILAALRTQFIAS